MSRHTGGQKGYEFYRLDCPTCTKSVAISFDPDGRHVWLRRHNRAKGEPCPQPRRVSRA